MVLIVLANLKIYFVRTVEIINAHFDKNDWIWFCKGEVKAFSGLIIVSFNSLDRKSTRLNSVTS